MVVVVPSQIIELDQLLSLAETHPKSCQKPMMELFSKLFDRVLNTSILEPKPAIKHLVFLIKHF